MTSASTGSERWFRIGGLGLAASGVAHLLWPRAFEPVNRMAFEDHIRAHVLINGSIETGLGVALLLNTRARRTALAATIVYLTYFTASLLRRQRTGLTPVAR